MLSLVVAGCAGAHQVKTESVVAASAAATEAAQTAEIDITISQSGQPPVTERIVYDFKQRIGETLSFYTPNGVGSRAIFDGTTEYVDLVGGTPIRADLYGKTWAQARNAAHQ